MKNSAMKRAAALLLLFAMVLGLTACKRRNPFEEAPAQKPDTAGGYLDSFMGGFMQETEEDAEPFEAVVWALVKSNCIVSDPLYEDMGHGKYYSYTYSFAETDDGSVVFKSSGGYYRASAGSDARDTYYECMKPPQTIMPGEELTLTARVYTENIVYPSDGSWGYMSKYTYLDIGTPDQPEGNDRYGSFCDQYDFATIYFEIEDGSRTMDESLEVSAVIPDALTCDRMSIYFTTEFGCLYEWQYALTTGFAASAGEAASTPGTAQAGLFPTFGAEDDAPEQTAANVP